MGTVSTYPAGLSTAKTTPKRFTYKTQQFYHHFLGQLLIKAPPLWGRHPHLLPPPPPCFCLRESWLSPEWLRRDEEKAWKCFCITHRVIFQSLPPDVSLPLTGQWKVSPEPKNDRLVLEMPNMWHVGWGTWKTVSPTWTDLWDLQMRENILRIWRWWWGIQPICEERELKTGNLETQKETFK